MQSAVHRRCSKGFKRPLLDISDIFRSHGESFRQKHRLTSEQRKAMRAIESCRTARLGGHLDLCSNCGYSEPAYNSCRNRHCPKCLNLAQSRWLDKQKARILPTHYFHVVFTLPRELRSVARQNPRVLFGILFQAASETLVAFGKDRLGALVGFTGVLHTWTRELLFHPHLHCIVTGGGLDQSLDQWTPASSRYLFPVKALSKLFRGKFLDKLSRAFDDGRIRFRTELPIDDVEAFHLLKDKLYRKDWLVYSKRPFAGAEQLLDYFGRYTHRVAISSNRLIRIGRDEVCFATKDGKSVTLSPEEFLSRFLDHVLPRASSRSGTTACSPPPMPTSSGPRGTASLSSPPPIHTPQSRPSCPGRSGSTSSPAST
jgi:hypothetical protein